jgi:hypothetical protein
MKRTLNLVSVLLAIVVFSGLIFAISFYYHGVINRASSRWTDESAGLQGQINSLERRVETLEKRPVLSVVAYQAFLATTDQPSNSFLLFERDGPLRTFQGKGSYIVPTLRIPFGSTNLHEFDVQCDKAIASWLTFYGPISGLSCFERFEAYTPWHSNGVVRIRVKLKPGASVGMDFHVQTLEEH